MWLLLENAILTEVNSVRPVWRLEPSYHHTQSQKQSAQLQLPYRIPGTTLVAEQLAAYEGPSLENGGSLELVNVAALLLRNTGTDGIESAQITLRWLDGSYYFAADTIPPGARVLVLEQNNRDYGQHIWSECSGTQNSGAGDWTGGHMLKIEQTGMGELTVTNISDRELYNIRLHYKSYLEPPGIYVGGITYKVGIKHLTIDQTVKLSPHKYASGYSGIVKTSAEYNE